MTADKYTIELKLRRARRIANNLIQRFGITEPKHIRLEDIAYCLNTTVIECNLKNASASLTRLGNKGVIRISSSISSIGRKRFCIGHELGHFCLEHKINLNKICSNDDISDWYTPSIEYEANEFASELLLPSKIIEPKCNVQSPSFSNIKSLAEEFSCSLTATAIKFVENCKEPCAIVYSKNAKIIWCTKNTPFYPYIGLNAPLSKRTFAFDYFNKGLLYDEMQEVDSEAWLTTPSLSLLEHTIKSYDNSALSLLWLRN